jgi:hypothetical protein
MSEAPGRPGAGLVEIIHNLAPGQFSLPTSSSDDQQIHLETRLQRAQTRPFASISPSLLLFAFDSAIPNTFCHASPPSAILHESFYEEHTLRWTRNRPRLGRPLIPTYEQNQSLPLEKISPFNHVCLEAAFDAGVQGPFEGEMGQHRSK